MRWKLLSIALILTAGVAQAATYYVAPGGNNGNAGTIGSPWQTIQKGFNTAVAGDTLYVRQGTYTERLTLPNSGTAGNYITLANYPGETPTVSGAGLGVGVAITGVHREYLKLIGFDITGFLGGGIDFLGQSRFIEIRNNTVRNQTYPLHSPPCPSPGTTASDGHAILVGSLAWPTLYQATNIIIDGNVIHDVDTGEDCAFDETLTLAWDIDGFQITNNTLYNYNFIGIDLIGHSIGFLRAITSNPANNGQPWPRRGVIAGNTVRNGGYTHGTGQAPGPQTNTGIYMDGGQQVVIEHNTVHNNSGYGIVTSSEESGYTIVDILIRHNVVYSNVRNLDCGGFLGDVAGVRCVHNTVYGGSIGNLENAQGSNVAWKNNISYALSNTYHIFHYLGLSNTPTLNYNLYWPTNEFYEYKGTSYFGASAFAQYKAATGQDANSLSQNPLFVSLGSDFHLQAGSPAINSGTPLTLALGTGTSTALPVQDARYFSDGFGMGSGDTIRVGASTAVVTGVNYGTNVLTLAAPVTWTNGMSVTYPYGGSAPDIGAFEESGPTLAAPTALLLSNATVTDTLSVTLTWSYTQGDVPATFFRLYRQPNCSGAFAQVGGAVALTPTTVTDGGLALISAYCWYVVAIDGSGQESSPSNTTRWDETVVPPPVVRAAPQDPLSRLGTLMLPQPVDRTHPLLAGLRSWWKVVRPLFGGAQVWDLAGRGHGDWGGLSATSGYRPSTRPGGEGDYLLSGPVAFGGDASHMRFGVDGSAGRVGAIPTPAFTFAAWVRGAQPTRTTLALHRPAGIGAAGWALYYDPVAGPAVACEVDIDTYGLFPGPLRTLATITLADTWTHLACTYDGSRLAVYLNGVQAGSTAVTSSLAGLNEFFLGWNGQDGTEWVGRVDDVQYFGAAKSSEAIGALMALSTQGSPGLLRRLSPLSPLLLPFQGGRFVRRGMGGMME